MRNIFILTIAFWTSSVVLAADANLQQQVDSLTKRVTALEELVRSLSGKDNWKDPVYWSRLKKEMPAADVKKLLGEPAHIEEQIFTTWYYHKASKLHSFVWFDEGKVLGWELPD
jgi:cell division protein FtsB